MEWINDYVSNWHPNASENIEDISPVFNGGEVVHETLSPHLNAFVAEGVEDTSQQNDGIRVTLTCKFFYILTINFCLFKCAQVVVDVDKVDIEHEDTHLSHMDHAPN